MTMDTTTWFFIRDGGAWFAAFFALVTLLTDITGEPGQHKVLLPHVPGTSDYMSDIRVLPHGYDVMNVTVVDSRSDSPGVTCIVSKDTGFRLAEGNCSLPALVPGLALITNVRATVIVYDGENSLVLPFSEDLSATYSLITRRPDENNHDTLPSYFIYPSLQNMSLRLCHKQSERVGDQMNISDSLTPPGVPAAENCSRINLTDYKGWVLNNVSVSQGMEISSNFPFGVLEWYNASVSPGRKWRQCCACSQRQLGIDVPVIIWRPYPDAGISGRRFLVPPSRGSDTSGILQFIVKTSNVTITVSQEDGNVTTFNYNARNTLEAPTDAWLLLNSTQTLRVRHVTSQEQSAPSKPGTCYQTLTMHPIDPIDALSVSDNTVAQTHKWIYAPCHNNISVICNPKANTSTPSLFDTERNIQLPFVFNVSMFGYTVTSYNLSAGLYSVHVGSHCIVLDSSSMTSSLQRCLLDVSTRVGQQGDVTHSTKNSSYSNIAATNISRTLHTDLKTSNTVSLYDTDRTRDENLKTDSRLFRTLIRTTANYTETYATKSPLQDSIIFTGGDLKINRSLQSAALTAISNKRPIYSTVIFQTTGSSTMVTRKHELENKEIDKRVDRGITTPLASVDTTSSNTTSVPVHANNKSVIRFLRLRNEDRQPVSKKNPSSWSSLSNHTGDAVISQPYTASVAMASVTQPNLPISVKQMDISDTNTDVNHADNLISNDRFKAVVDIIHSGDQHIGSDAFHTDGHVLVNSKKNPVYTHKSESSDRFVEFTSDKSLMAIIISLCTALVAVVGIILIFLLIEFFSRKRHIRKTRIRPYVSYY